jgi:hypothetical protein
MLTDDQRRTIISIISNGSSRRVAARYARCATSTITRLAARDPKFASQLAVAEKSVEIDALRAIRTAAKSDRYWRAAAWLLERTNPEDFASRPPTLFTGEEVFEIVGQIVGYLYELIPDENCELVMRHLDEILEKCRKEQTTATFPQPKPKSQFAEQENLDFSSPYKPTKDFCCDYPDACPEPFSICQYYPNQCPHRVSLESAENHNLPATPESPTPKMQHPSFATRELTISPPTITPNNPTTSNTQHLT